MHVREEAWKLARKASAFSRLAPGSEGLEVRVRGCYREKRERLSGRRAGAIPVPQSSCNLQWQGSTLFWFVNANIGYWRVRCLTLSLLLHW